MSELMLKMAGVNARYGAIQVLRDVNLEVAKGEVVVVLGANGAGKTTTLRAICSMVATTGSIQIAGTEVVGKDTADIVRMQVAHVPQGRGTFPELSVTDNLMVGAYTRKDKEVQSDIDRWMDAFPRLRERRTQAAGSLSGGEQQMLAVARAMMCRPQLLLLVHPGRWRQGEGKRGRCRARPGQPGPWRDAAGRLLREARRRHREQGLIGRPKARTFVCAAVLGCPLLALGLVP